MLHVFTSVWGSNKGEFVNKDSRVVATRGLGVEMGKYLLVKVYKLPAVR